jgi:hypothetical protein
LIPTDIAGPAIAAGAGLLGVAVGGYFIGSQQKRERQQRHIGEQLAEFYSPMVALCLQVIARRELRRKIAGEADSTWWAMTERAYQGKDQGQVMDHVDKLLKERAPAFDKMIDYDNQQLAEETIPAYRRMLELFTAKMYLAEFSTAQYFPVLLDFVEIWERCLSDSLPREVVRNLKHSDEPLLPFYADLADNFARLQQALREKRYSWFWWRRPPAPKVQGPPHGVNPFAGRRT